MIKINLATRKQSGTITDSKVSKSSPIEKINVDALRDLPIKKLIVPVAAALIISYLADSYKEDELNKLDTIIAALNAEGARLLAEINRLKSFEAVKKQLEEDELTIRTKIDTIQKLIADRSNPPKFLISIANAIPKDVWLSDFKTDLTDVTLRGGALGFNQVSDFMKNLTENAFFASVDLSNSQQSKEEGGAEIATFELKAKRR